MLLLKTKVYRGGKYSLRIILPAPVYRELPRFNDRITCYILLANSEDRPFGIFDFALLRCESVKPPSQYEQSIVWVKHFGSSMGFNLALRHAIVQKLGLQAGSTLLVDVLDLNSQACKEFSSKAIVFAKADQTAA